MKIKAEELNSLFIELMEIIDENFKNERHIKLTNMYQQLQERIMMAPASSNKGYFGAYPGGYMKHVLKVVEISKILYKLWEKMGADMSTYTHEELIFAALNHSLGKLGNETEELYIPNKSQWHIENKGDIYMFNPDVTYMPLPDRAIWLLQKFGIDMSENEYIAIKTYEGLLNEGNNTYLKTHNPNSHLPILLHQANYMAYRIAHETDKK